MGVFDAVPHDVVTELDDLDGADSGDDSPLASATPTKSALSKKERSEMVTRDQGAAESEKAPVASHLKDQGPGDDVGGTSLYSFGKEPTMEALCCQITADGRMVAAGCRDGRVRIASSQADVGLMHTLGNEFPGSLAPSVTALRWRPNSWTASETKNVLLVARGEEILHYHATSGRLMSAASEGSDNQIYALATCLDDQLFASAGLDRNLRIYHEGRSDAPALLKSGGAGGLSGHSMEAGSEGSGHSNSIYAVSWVPGSPDVLVSGGWDQTVQIWDRRVGHAVRSIFGPYICGDGLDVHDGKVLTGSWRGKTPLQLWDLGSGQLLTNLPIHQPCEDACFLYGAKFGAGAGHCDTLIAGGSGREPAVHIMKNTGVALGYFKAKSNVHAIDTAATDQGLSVAVCCAEELALLDLPPLRT